MSAIDSAQRLTRRQLLAGAAGAAGAAAVGAGTYGGLHLVGGQRPLEARPPGPARAFVSRSDLRPAAVAVAGASAEPGYLLLAPGALHGSQSGPLIVDDSGEPVWFRPLSPGLWATNFTVASSGGQPVLAWWEGVVQVPLGYGHGESVLVDGSYRELARIRAANGRRADLHELRLTPEGTALFTCFPELRTVDLSELGGPREGRVLESIIQEVDVESGRLLMEWRSLEHIPVAESYRPLADPYDYLHVNSIDFAPDGNLLVSARHAWAIYKLDRRTGEVIWRLGGKRSDFDMGPGAQFSWQHDARLLDARTMTVFDNCAYRASGASAPSRAIVLDVDIARRTAQLRHSYTHPEPLLAVAMGSVQVLPDGRVLVGWGSQPYASEFTADGTIVLDTAMTRGQQSYRTFRLPWHGTPTDPPAIAAIRDSSTGNKTLFASWNGSTEATHWQLQAGPASSNVSPRAIVKRTGFETAIPLATEHRYAAVTALDASSRQLATSRTIKL